MNRPPIPTRLNLLLSALVFCSALLLLWLASHTGSVLLMAALAVAYSFLLLTNYALLHEGTHGLLHPDPRVNNGLGMLLAWLFPVAFTLLNVSHSVHHRYNRTDHEMYAALPENALAVHVGGGADDTRYTMESPARVREFLGSLIAVEEPAPVV